MGRLITDLDTIISPVLLTGMQIDAAINGQARSTIAGVANRVSVVPLILPRDVSISALNVEVTTGVASAQGKIVLYDSDTSNKPANLIQASGDLDFATSGVTRSYSYIYTFKAGVVYWLGIHNSSTATLRGIPVAALRQLGVVTGTSAACNTAYILSSTYASGAPASLASAALASVIAPSIKLVVA